MARTSLEPWKFILDIGSLSLWGLVMAPDLEADGDNLRVSLIFYKIMGSWLGGSDVHSTGDQEALDLTPVRLATFFCGDWSWNIFYGHSLPSADSQRAAVTLWRKNMHNTR